MGSDTIRCDAKDKVGFGTIHLVRTNVRGARNVRFFSKILRTY